jgi:hypothetical protein
MILCARPKQARCRTRVHFGPKRTGTGYAIHHPPTDRTCPFAKRARALEIRGSRFGSPRAHRPRGHGRGEEEGNGRKADSSDGTERTGAR